MWPDIHPNHPRPSASKREPEPGIKLPLLLLLFLVLVIAGGGYLLFSQMQRTETLAAQQNLAAIAELKADQINQWIERNKSNAMITSRASPVADRTRMWFGKGMRGGEDLEWLHARLEALRKIYSSSEMIIADVTGKALISTEPQLPDLTDLDPLMRRAVEENRPLIGDFRWTRQRRGNPYISVPIVAPLIPTGEDSRAIGVLLIMADANQFLYPLIQKWPTPSETAETLLIQRDGEEVLFLNELRHRQGTALSLRFPVSNRSLLVSRAIAGEGGFVSGIDYRGEPVIGFSTGIPDTNWIMVAKIDQREVYAPIRQTAAAIISSALVLLLISSLVLYLWWRQRKERNRAAQLQNELNRQLIESQYEALSKYANDIILMIDSNYTIRDANDRAEDAFGYPRTELIGKSLIDLMDPVEANAFDPHRQQTLQNTGFVFESRMRHRDGRVFPVEVSGRPIKAGNEVFVQNIIRDISERKRLESDLRRSEQRFRTVLANRQITVFEQDEDLRYTWYHHLEQGENPERVIGRHDADLMDEGSAAAVEAVKRSVLESGAPRRFESCIALYDGRQECFDLYAEPRRDDSGRVVGIVGMTVDITERKLEARRLERTSRLLQETQAIARVGGWELDLANRRLYWTEETYHIHDTTPDEYRPSMDTALRFYPPESVDVITQAVQDAIEHKKPFDLELPIVSAKGREVWVRTTCRVIEENGQAVRIIGAFQDITDRKRFEDELRRREQEYRRLVEGLPKTNIARFDAERRFIYASPGVGEKFGVSVDFLLGKRPTETGFDPDFAAALEERIVHVLQTGKGISYQRSYETVQGSNHREFNLIPEFVENGHVRTVLHTSYDITEMKALEDTLRLERAQLRAAIDSMVDEVWFTDGAGNIILTNDSAVKNLGFDSRDTFFQNIQQALAGLEIFEQDGTPRTYERAPLVRALKGEVLKNYGELIKNNKTGELRYREVSSAPVRDAQGDIIGSVGVVRDLTERKRIENALRESEAQFRQVAESLPQLVFTTLPDGHNEYYNERWREYSGMSPEEAKGELWAELLHPDDRERAFASWQYSLRTGQPYSIEYRLRSKDGTYRWFMTRATPLRDQKGRIVRWFGACIDIHEQRTAQEALRESEERYRSLFSNMTEGLALCEVVRDASGKAVNYRYLEVNQGFTDQTGLSQEQVQGKVATDAMPKLEPIWIERFLRVAETGEPLRFTEYNADTDRSYDINCYSTAPGRFAFLARDITQQRQTEAALRRSEGQFRLLAESLPQLVWITRADGYAEYFNRQWYNYTGASPEENEAELWPQRVHPEDRQRTLEAWERSIATGEPYNIEYRLRRRDGTCHWFLARALPVRDELGNITRWFGTSTDIDDLREAQEELQLAALVYQESAEAMMVTDEHNHIVAINPAFERLTGYRANEIVGKNPLLLSSGKDNHVHYREMLDKLMKGHYWQGELWLSKKNGEVFAAGMTINTTFRPDGSVNRHVALFNDVTQRKQAEEQVWQQANFDTLTGLPNRRHFLDQLRQEIRKSRRSRQSFALMFLDLDGFKYVNDTLGHEAGDLLLKETAERLAKCVRETDTIARLGGDEFTILLADQPGTRHAEKVARHILHKLSEPFQLGKEVAHISASLGITFHPQDGASVDDLLINADQAMYAAKEAGKNRFSFFTADMQRAAQERTWFIAELRNAIDSRQFRLVYQPIVELSTGCINKVEALLRWEHPERGAIDPSVFIPIAEETGIIQDIGDWVFFEAANQVAKWRRTYHPDFQVSINKSPVQFKSKVDDLAAWFDHLKRLNLPGQSIAVEITEGVLMDESKAVTDQLIAFRDAGIEVSLDDFGTGYSTLSYLKRFDIDRLKIDQTFIRDLETDPNDQALCEAMIVMGHKLGIKVIAEGVETDRQRDILAQAGCDFVQGYLLSNPVSAEALERLLQRGTAPCAPDAPET